MREQKKPGVFGLSLITLGVQLLLTVAAAPFLRRLSGGFSCLLTALLMDLLVLVPALLLYRSILRGLPGKGKPLAVDAMLLLDHGFIVSAAAAPEALQASLSMRTGPSMLLLAHAAVLAGCADDEGRAARRAAAEAMKLDPDRLEHHMPLVEKRPVGGVIWYVRRDSRTLTAFASGSAQQIIPLCRSIQRQQAVPLDEETRAALYQGLSGQRLPVRCYAMAQMDEETGRLTRVTYLGAFCYDEALMADAGEQLDMIRAMGHEPSVFAVDAMLQKRVSERLSVPEAADDQLYLLVPENSPVPMSTQVPKETRPADFLLNRRQSAFRALFAGLQLVTVFSTVAIAGVFLRMPALYLLLLFALLLPLQISSVFSFRKADYPAARSLIGLGIRTVLAAAVSWFAGAYANICGMSGVIIALTALIPCWCMLCRAAFRDTEKLPSWLWIAYACVVSVILMTCALLNGLALLPMAFALLSGCFAWAFGVLVIPE